MAVRKPASAGAARPSVQPDAAGGRQDAPRAAPAAPAPAATPGLALVERAVSFNRQQLSAVSPSSAGAMSDPAGEQAAALMVEDLRSYMQGSEQVVLAASAQAMKLLLDPATQETGTAALAALTTYQAGLITFAGSVVTTAGSIKGEFGS